MSGTFLSPISLLGASLNGALVHSIVYGSPHSFTVRKVLAYIEGNGSTTSEAISVDFNFLTNLNGENFLPIWSLLSHWGTHSLTSRSRCHSICQSLISSLALQRNLKLYKFNESWTQSSTGETRQIATVENPVTFDTRVELVQIDSICSSIII